MKCCCCGAELDSVLHCPVCGASHKTVCPNCIAEISDRAGSCRICGEERIPAWNVSREEMKRLGIHAFMPYRMERNNDIYLGGNRDNGGYDFQNYVGYHGELREKIVLPGLVESLPVFGIWNEFFCLGSEFAPNTYRQTFERMSRLKIIEVGNGTREIFTYAFYGCCGLERLILPRTLKTLYYDFYDLFTDGEKPMQNGVFKTPVTIEYRGSREEWERIGKTSRILDYIKMGKIVMQYNQ